MRLALVEAGKGAIGEIADQIRLLCYGFSASVGFYADRIRILLMAAGFIATSRSTAAGLTMLARASPARAEARVTCSGFDAVDLDAGAQDRCALFRPDRGLALSSSSSWLP